MHIAINGWFAKQLTTGSGHYLEQLLRHLPAVMGEAGMSASAGGAGQAHKLSLLLPFPHRAYRLTAIHTTYPAVEVIGVRLPPLPGQLRKLCWEQIAVPLAARRLDADLLWVPYWAAPLWQPCPVIVTVHDIIHRILPAYHGGILQRLYTQLVSYTAQRAAAMITVSHAAGRDITTALAPADDRLHIVYNGLPANPAYSADDFAAIRRKYQLPKRFFLYLGGFDRRKNVPTTLAAYKRYLDKGGDPAVQLVIAGELPTVDSTFSPDPRRIAAELMLTDHVHFCGYVEEEEKAALYALATAYIFPGLYEGFGLMVLEAMQAGTPVITSAR
ncbi:MAG TPA: glycosyltransferase family 1 protein [Caldilineaceae bacterium]|nr:glycosyltransferase family 1 protein [Caldilineaceae bacterium]